MAVNVPISGDAVQAAKDAGGASRDTLDFFAKSTDAELRDAFPQFQIEAYRKEYQRRIASLDEDNIRAQALNIPAPTPAPPVTMDELVPPKPVTPSRQSEQIDKDKRVRLSSQHDKAIQTQVYGPENDANNIMALLHKTGGMVFPYTPTISYSATAEYRALDTVHSNQEFLAYARSGLSDINIVGDFTVQNQIEGEYALACIHFLRTVSKMYFGEGGNDPGYAAKRGLPPPVLLLNGYGTYMFNNLRVIVRSFSFNLDKSVDYVDVKVANGLAHLPALFQINVQLAVQNTPDRQRREFNLDEFRTGALMRKPHSGWL